MTEVSGSGHGAPIVVVAAALTDPAGRVLVQKRPEGKAMAGLWEFPGGKVEPGESPEDALCRELEEELGLCVARAELKPIGFSTGAIAGGTLILLLYRCRRWQGEATALHASALQWCAPANLSTLAMPPADIPLNAMLAALPDW